MPDFLSIDDLSVEELTHLLDRSAVIKADPGLVTEALSRVGVALIFEKPSTRTRTSFEIAVGEMGGIPVVLDSGDSQLGRGETIEDSGAVLSRYVSIIVLRTFEHSRLEALATAAEAPVINALSDHEHPCQAVGDLFTIRERKGHLEGLTVTYVGDGNNTCHALMLAGAKQGMHLRVAAPIGYEPDASVLERAEKDAAVSGGSVEVTDDPVLAATGADVLYTDVWASMGHEAEASERDRVFPPFQLNEGLLAVAAADAIVLHCLPAHRGQEITDAVIDGPQSVVLDQAENRLHTQKALLLRALGRLDAVGGV